MAFAQAPTPGSALMLTRFHRGPDGGGGVALLPGEGAALGLLAQSGFCAMRTLFDRRSGRGVAGLSWDDPAAMEAGEEVLRQNMSAAAAPGLHLDGSHLIEILVFEVH